MEERFLYEIRPVRPIIINGRRTRRACSLNLTKDEVKEYLASANVYRRFGGTDVVKVTGANLDQLHVSKEARGNINPDAEKDNLGDKAPDNNQEGITGDPIDDKVDNNEKSVETDNSDNESEEDTDETPSVDETAEDSTTDTTEDDTDSDDTSEETEDSDTEESYAESAEEDQTEVEKIDTAEDDNGSIADNENIEETEEEKAEPVKASNIQERAKVIRPNYQQYNGNRKKKKNHK